jgi:hypothetical protein
MSVNKELKHLLIIPEDNANRQLVIGFLLRKNASCQTLRVAGGWLKAFEAFTRNSCQELGKYPHRHVVVVIDFDDQIQSRSERFAKLVPNEFKDRVFLLGSRSEPEKLKTAMQHKTLETIGGRLADTCLEDDSQSLWAHELLTHNLNERRRMMNTLGIDFWR